MMKIDAQATGFNLENAKALAMASNLAYKDFGKSAVQNKIQSLVNGESTIKYFDKNGSQAFLAADNEKIIIAFRGTEPKALEDWVADAKVRKTSGPFGDVHRGFFQALNYIWPSIEDAIDDVRDNDQTIWITGHSLGASLATLATALLHTREEPLVVSGLYTFGSPRVGGHGFAKKFNKKISGTVFRFVNNNDVVTRVPLSVRYSHVGSLLYFDNDGQLHTDSDLGWWGKFWDRVEGRLDGFLHLDPADGVSDHSMDGYEKNMMKA